MNEKRIRKTAILVDGGYYRKRAIALWGKNMSAQDRASELFKYCLLHLSEPSEPRDLYRIFYYDCPPMSREMIHPLTKKKINYAEMPGSKWTNLFYDELLSKRKVALRRGELAETQAYYTLKQDVLLKVLNGTKKIDKLTESDFRLEVKQKGVDMRIGLDVASIAYGGYAEQIILIAGDSDFIPVAKMARKNGIDFILDPMGQNIKPKLSEHIDGIETYTDKMYLPAEEDAADIKQ